MYISPQKDRTVPFQQSKESANVDELIEAKASFDNFLTDSPAIIDFINQNADFDHKNDQIRSEVTQHLIYALTAANMRSFEDVHKHIHAAVQKLHSQEALDLKDDQPRTNALMVISQMREKAIRQSERLRELTGSAERKRRGKRHERLDEKK